VRTVEVWAQATAVRFLASFEATVPSISGSASQADFEQEVIDAARKHFGETTRDREFVVAGCLPQYKEPVTSLVTLDGMEIDWEYVDGVAQQYEPAWDDDIPATLEYTVAASYRHELTPEEEALGETGLHAVLEARAQQLAWVMNEDLEAFAGFKPGNGCEADSWGYDEARS